MLEMLMRNGGRSCLRSSCCSRHGATTPMPRTTMWRCISSLPATQAGAGTLPHADPHGAPGGLLPGGKGMIRKLRLKIVGISVVTVAAVLICALVVLTLSTRSQMVHSSEGASGCRIGGKCRQEPAARQQRPALFCGGGVYRRNDTPLRQQLLQPGKSGAGAGYRALGPGGKKRQRCAEGLFPAVYAPGGGVVSVRIAFTDCSMGRATVRSLLLRGGLLP